MKEYIEREAFLSVLLDMATDYEELDDCTAETIKMCIRELNKAPAADVVEHKRGEWIWDGNAMDWGLGGWVCSECHAKNDNIPAKPDVIPYAWQGSHFCPNCGCQMVGDENGRS